MFQSIVDGEHKQLLGGNKHMFPLPLYSVWPYTPAIPAFYWDAKSTEEIIKYLACEYGHITSYFDELTNAINNLSADVQTFETDIENRVSAMEQSLATLLDNLEHVGDRMVIYDPTKGAYVDSKIAMRDMYRELAVFGARVNQIATKTVDNMATHRTDETAAVGNLTIFNDATPRVTDPKTGNPYTPIQ